jgi:hypothetical protein
MSPVIVIWILLACTISIQMQHVLFERVKLQFKHRIQNFLYNLTDLASSVMKIFKKNVKLINIHIKQCKFIL